MQYTVKNTSEIINGVLKLGVKLLDFISSTQATNNSELISSHTLIAPIMMHCGIVNGQLKIAASAT